MKKKILFIAVILTAIISSCATQKNQHTQQKQTDPTFVVYTEPISEPTEEDFQDLVELEVDTLEETEVLVMKNKANLSEAIETGSYYTTNGWKE